ncbi:hypothetical protein K0504_01400 [Neiella marina]|uniref:Alpha-glutamyl/putrescinyl thymine pyrophosphorylase clade 3 domain-containing protein n=1 Tax=Neiella holothuriorum TaxID=2870530 RepID=A0ABS7EBH0_9GAMM|nr:hypothetical protein [Neiella holothuriorum]MBW8189677.1 hypothetical protein [Neiella holothuriorum]
MTMRIRNNTLFNNFKTKLDCYSKQERTLEGLQTIDSLEVLSCQLVDSVRRVNYLAAIANRPISDTRKNPNSSIFDPLRAAVLHLNDGNFDEACWLVFLSTHFGKNIDTGWQLCADIYSCYGGDELWSWQNITDDFQAFAAWYQATIPNMLLDGIKRKFGNHRKYETLRIDSHRSTLRVLRSYVEWVGGTRSHEVRFNECGNIEDRYALFDNLYASLKSVSSFGRTAKFDYLTMLNKVGIIDIEPAKLYLSDATGPKQGAKQLFFANPNRSITNLELESRCVELADYLPIEKLKMQVLEDALCNWQKSPENYRYFGG